MLHRSGDRLSSLYMLKRKHLNFNNPSTGTGRNCRHILSDTLYPRASSFVHGRSSNVTCLERWPLQNSWVKKKGLISDMSCLAARTLFWLHKTCEWHEESHRSLFFSFACWSVPWGLRELCFFFRNMIFDTKLVSHSCYSSASTLQADDAAHAPSRHWPKPEFANIQHFSGRTLHKRLRHRATYTNSVALNPFTGQCEKNPGRYSLFSKQQSLL